jgi:oligopeptidase B
MFARIGFARLVGWQTLSRTTMKKRSAFSFLFIFVGAPSAWGQLDSGVAKPPLAKKVPHEVILHGDRRVDNYYWLRDKKNPEVTAYLEAENAYTATVVKPTEPLQATLYQEMLARIKQTDLTVPYRKGGYVYYSRTEEGKQYPIQCRRRHEADAKEEIILDLNELAQGHKFLGLGAFAVSDDANLLAYSTDFTGFRQYTLRIKDVRSNRLLPDRIEKVVTVAWAADNRTLFYTVEDAAKRSYRLYRHILGAATDDLIYEEKDELYRIAVRRSRDEAYLFLSAASATTTEFHALPSLEPRGKWKVLLPRQNDHKYLVEHRNGLFYLLTNKDAKNFHLVTAPDQDPRPENWKELIPHREKILLEGVDVFARYAIIMERENGLPVMRVLDLESNKDRPVEFTEPTFAVFPDNNPEFQTEQFRFRYQSLVTPESVYELDMNSGARKLLKQTVVLGGYDRSAYALERLFATAADGEKIPISLVYKKSLRRDGGNPMLLYGYGSYGSSLQVIFNSARLSLLDRGVIFALAHIRGGKEMGEAWHDQGRMMFKRNTFTDFIAVADHLVAEKYTSHDLLAIEGGSAGGLLIGAVLNFRPDLCHVAVLHVPFVDVINSMLDETLPLTVGEFLEWGNPKIKKEYDYMKTYCPYTNIAAKNYPAMLVRTSLNDSQVMFWEPAKYVAKMRATRTDSNPLLLKVNMAAGHGGASGRYDASRKPPSPTPSCSPNWGLQNNRHAFADRLHDCEHAAQASSAAITCSRCVLKSKRAADFKIKEPRTTPCCRARLFYRSNLSRLISLFPWALLYPYRRPWACPCRPLFPSPSPCRRPCLYRRHCLCP